MKKKKLIKYAIVLTLLIAIYLLFFRGSSAKVSYTYASVTKGNLDVVITSTGTLEATSTVDVGTQVSGKVAKLFVDFNNEVKKGQLLAVIDTITLVAQVRDAQANLAKAKAEYKQKVAIHERNKKLFEKNFLSELDFIESQTNVDAAAASLSSAESALERAQTNLSYAYIYAPIAGKIINRSVEQGQTVAASLSAPTLFTIAEDLSSMRILASVDESDIGQIANGQKVKFTVQAYSDKTFEGTVTQIRLKPAVSSNVVNYTVVIHADNKNNLLLPGMTATIDFYVNHRENVLLVPNSALRFEASEELMKEAHANMEEDRANLPDSIKNKLKNIPPPPLLQGVSSSSTGAAKNNMFKIFFVNVNGKKMISPVMTGLTDGKNTEITRSRELKEGTKIIIGESGNENSGTEKSGSTSNSILPSQQQNMPPPPM